MKLIEAMLISQARNTPKRPKPQHPRATGGDLIGILAVLLGAYIAYKLISIGG